MTGQWTTRCPHCGTSGQLKVISAVLVATGKRIKPNTPLCPDGFEVDPTGRYEKLKDQSTDDEKVRCAHCGEKFDLPKLSLNWIIPEVGAVRLMARIKINELCNLVTDDHSFSRHVVDGIPSPQITVPRWRLRMEINEAEAMAEHLLEAVKAARSLTPPGAKNS